MTLRLRWNTDFQTQVGHLKLPTLGRFHVSLTAPNHTSQSVCEVELVSRYRGDLSPAYRGTALVGRSQRAKPPFSSSTVSTSPAALMDLWCIAIRNASARAAKKRPRGIPFSFPRSPLAAPFRSVSISGTPHSSCFSTSPRPASRQTDNPGHAWVGSAGPAGTDLRSE